MKEDEYIEAQKELDEAVKKLKGQGKRQEKPAEPPFCAFCGKSKDKVKVLVAGPAVYMR